MTLRLILADDHPVVREGARALLEADSDFEVVGQADDGSKVPTWSIGSTPMSSCST